MATPKLLSRKANGVGSNSAPSDAPKAPRIKTAPEGEKVVIRRLPPAMTEEEFLSILGDEWKLGRGNVDWYRYCPGKVSQHAAKPSQPSRAYLRVTKRDLLMALSEVVRTAEWVDAKASFNDPALIGPPVVEFSMYKKVPSDKKRTDGRQGTIDQDPEFMAFLESLANPDAHKDGETTEQSGEELTKGEKPTTTPLIEHLREKAAKAKETAAAKSAKHSRQDSQGGKGKAVAVAEEPKKKGKEPKTEKVSEKAAGKAPEKPKELVKILSKKAAAESAAEAARAVTGQIQASKEQAKEQTSTTEAPPKSRRAGIAAAARILQRDLGLSPGNAHRKARQDMAKAEAESKASSSKEPAQQVVVAPKETTPPTTPVEPSPSTSASAPSKSRRSGRGRGGRGTGPGAGEDGTKSKDEAKADAKGEPKAEKPAESSSKPPVKPPIILMKKRDDRKEISTPSPSQSPAPGSSSAASAPPAGPKAGSSKQTPAPKKGAGSSAPVPSHGATRAFVKHANHSQGVTDQLLREALQVFGTVTSVDINRKKGFAYVDFADHEALVKAMSASPIAVAQGSVQVLERKEAVEKKGGGGGKEVASTPGNAGESSSAAPPSASAGATSGAAGASSQEKAGPSQDKHRGGRRRGGRGKGDKDPGSKDSGSGGKSADAGAA
ncbi:Smg-4/UPF3 family-domain-containing protein [Cercophora newfieldiana]|uniref:Smg-4/UPF3 family-domain-containing protein n=1 Tax=Cercophora newfieldiana TaxID=92897 RepID=A0AA40CWV5_9PEZI|nr:Smg-4/UPF3 family-domain-containing protein [Cercophora newfieldiana]